MAISGQIIATLTTNHEIEAMVIITCYSRPNDVLISLPSWSRNLIMAILSEIHTVSWATNVHLVVMISFYKLGICMFNLVIWWKKSHWKPILVHVLFACWKVALLTIQKDRKKNKNETHPQRFLRILVEKKTMLPMWPPCQWRRQKIRVLTGRPGAPCRFFFSPSPQMPTQPTGAANRGGGVKKLTSELYVEESSTSKGRVKMKP